MNESHQPEFSLPPPDSDAVLFARANELVIKSAQTADPEQRDEFIAEAMRLRALIRSRAALKPQRWQILDGDRDVGSRPGLEGS